MSSMSRFVLLAAAVAQFVAPTLPLYGIGTPIGDRAVEAGIPPELPVGVFFSIWSVIFFGYLATAIWHWRSPDYASGQIAMPLALAGFGNVAWMLSAQSIGHPALDLILLAPILFFAWWAAYRLDQTGGYDGTGRSIVHAVTVGLLAGWLSVAISISVPDFVRWGLGRGPTDAVWQSLWLTLIPATILAYVFANYFSRNRWYFVALSWGLLGIIVNNWSRTGTHALAIAAAVVGAYILLRRIRFGARGSYPAKP